MNIHVNGKFLAQRVTGVQRYALEVTDRWKNHPDIHVQRPPAEKADMALILWEQQLARLDGLLWNPCNSGPMLKRPQVTTIHDTAIFDHPQWFDRKFVVWYRVMMPTLYRQSRTILTVSEFSRGQLRRHLGQQNIEVIPPGISDMFRLKEANETVLGKYNLQNQSYLLYVGSIDPRKNIQGAIHAVLGLQDTFPGLQLVVVGDKNKVLADMEIHLQSPHIRFLGYVSDVDLPHLYAGARIFLFPSHYEGFGLPVLEAMAAGAPVVTSNTTALPEATAGNALLVDPSSTNEIAQAITRLLKDPTLTHEMKERGRMHTQPFTWEKTAQHILQVLNATKGT